MAVLRYFDDSDQFQVKALDTERFVVGRIPTAHIIFDDELISREHLAIEIDRDGRFRARDLGSRNRTFVNGEQVTETLLQAGDVIRVGDRVLEFVDDSDSKDKIDSEFLTPDKTEPPNCDWVKTKAPVSLTMQQVAQLSRLYGDQPLTVRAEDIAASALGQIILDTQADRGLIALRGESKTELRPLVHRGLARPKGASLAPVSQSFMFAPILQSVAGRYPQTASQVNAKLGYASVGLVAPLKYRNDIVGAVYVDRPYGKKPFTAAQLQYLSAAGAQVGALIGDASRKLISNSVREGAAWIATLRRLHEAMSAPVESTDSFNAAMKHYPGRVRCGDFTDVIQLDEQRCGVVTIDGGGHGVTGIVQAGAIRSAISTTVAVSEDALMDPASVFNELNRSIAQAGTRQVLPCTYIGIDMASGKLVYINAGGMPPLLMVAPGRLVTLDEPSLVLGVDPDYVYAATRVDLPEKFRIVCHTDGLVEASSVGGEPLGEERLHEALLDNDAFQSVSDIVAKADQTWTNHLGGSQPDDDALLVVVSHG